MLRRVCVTGGAGFIGSHLCDELLANGIQVRILDNLRTGRPEFIPEGVEFFEGDISDYEALVRAFDGCDWVCHLAANADVRHGFERVRWDLDQNAAGTLNVLEAMRHVGVKKIFFSSTASVYGTLRMDGISEDAPFPAQNSLYGASKVYGEGLISAYCEGFGFLGVIGRWVNVMGERFLHGSLIDWTRKLLRDPEHLEILGDGRQSKSGIYVKDLARGIVTLMKHNDNKSGFHTYNLATNELYTVDECVEMVCKILNVDPTYDYTGRTNGGWVGDNPVMRLCADKALLLGWKPEVSIAETVDRTINWFLSDECTYL